MSTPPTWLDKLYAASKAASKAAAKDAKAVNDAAWNYVYAAENSARKADVVYDAVADRAWYDPTKETAKAAKDAAAKAVKAANDAKSAAIDAYVAAEDAAKAAAYADKVYKVHRSNKKE